MHQIISIKKSAFTLKARKQFDSSRNSNIQKGYVIKKVVIIKKKHFEN